MAKAKKKRVETFIPKLSIDGTFEEMIPVSVPPTPDKKKELKKSGKKKKS